MPAAYSIDLRQRIINAYEAKEGSQRKVAKRFQVSLSFVKRLISRYRDTGLVKPKSHGGGARAKITVSDLAQIKQLVEEQPDAHCESYANAGSKNRESKSVIPQCTADCNS